MSTRVYTESTCDRCNGVHRRDGAETAVPPVGWARFSLSYRVEGPGWSGGGRRVEATLCQSCAAVAERVTAQGANPGEEVVHDC